MNYVDSGTKSLGSHQELGVVLTNALSLLPHNSKMAYLHFLENMSFIASLFFFPQNLVITAIGLHSKSGGLKFCPIH